ncbi:MAG: hypothetical protein HC904_08745 [Blastochloris sp.]|nr:hypothetical protein [Blastochloris sp.]
MTGKGKGEVYYDSDESNIKVLALDAEGALLAGSAENGYLYRITEKGKAVVLLDSDKEEISAIALREDGTIFVSAIGKKTLPNKAAEPPKPSPDKKTASPQPSNSFATEEVAPGAAVAPKSAVVNRPSIKGDASVLYKVSANFYPEAVWSCPQPILSLLGVGTDVWIGTANKGTLYQYSQEGKIRKRGKLEAADVTVLLATGSQESLLAVTSNLGQVFKVEGRGSLLPGKLTIYQSKALDTQLFSEWGNFRVEGEGKWTVRTRSGNTTDPDKSWHPWQYLDGSLVASPPARFLQWEIALKSGWVERVEWFYLPQNQAPQINSITVLEPGLAYELLSQPSPPPQAQTVDQLIKTPMPSPTPQERLQPVSRPGFRTAVWQASDANKDDLSFQVEIQKRGRNPGMFWQRNYRVRFFPGTARAGRMGFIICGCRRMMRLTILLRNR